MAVGHQHQGLIPGAVAAGASRSDEELPDFLRREVFPRAALGVRTSAGWRNFPVFGIWARATRHA